MSRNFRSASNRTEEKQMRGRRGTGSACSQTLWFCRMAVADKRVALHDKCCRNVECFCVRIYFFYRLSRTLSDNLQDQWILTQSELNMVTITLIVPKKVSHTLFFSPIANSGAKNKDLSRIYWSTWVGERSCESYQGVRDWGFSAAVSGASWNVTQSKQSTIAKQWESQKYNCQLLSVNVIS